MKQFTRYGALLVLALVVGVGVYALMPVEAQAYTCGFGCHARIGCNGQGDCDPGLVEFGAFYYGAPHICDHVCHFYASGCVPEDECW